MPSEHLSLLSGENAEDILDTTRIFAENKKYSKVIEEFDNCFKVCKDMIYESTQFNKRNQLLNESVEQFITEVHRLGYSCKFGKMKEDQISDRSVGMIHDHSLSKQLQIEPDLNTG